MAGAHREPLGQFWVDAERDPDDETKRVIPDEGVLWSQPAEDNRAPRDLGYFAVTSRYDISPNGVIQIPMVAVRATLNSGHQGTGAVRADRGGWLTVYAYAGSEK